MKQKLYLHVGMHRAQSTSLQYGLNYLFNLDATKFYYPLIGRTAGEELSGHSELVDQSNKSIVPGGFENFKIEAAEYSRDLPIILSSEEFWRVNPSDFGVLADEFDIHPVIVKRELYGWLMSIWSLVYASGALPALPREFFCSAAEDFVACRKSGGISFFDIERKISLWELFAPNKVNVINFPAPNLLGDVFSLAGIDVPKKWREMHVKTNESKSLEELLLERQNSLILQTCTDSEHEARKTLGFIEEGFGVKVPEAVQPRFLQYLRVIGRT